MKNKTSDKAAHYSKPVQPDPAPFILLSIEQSRTVSTSYLVILGRQVHIVIRERFIPSDPQIPGKVQPKQEQSACKNRLLNVKHEVKNC